MTLGEFRRQTKDMPDDAQIVMRYKDWADGGKLFVYNIGSRIILRMIYGAREK